MGKYDRSKPYNNLPLLPPKEDKIITISILKALNDANKALAVDKTFGLGWIALGEAYEASAEKCVDAKDGKIDYTDKLVYKLAVSKFKKAMKDPAYRADAERKISYAQPFAPTADDDFMHKGEKISGECYTWIN